MLMLMTVMMLMMLMLMLMLMMMMLMMMMMLLMLMLRFLAQSLQARRSTLDSPLPGALPETLPLAAPESQLPLDQDQLTGPSAAPPLPRLPVGSLPIWLYCQKSRLCLAEMKQILESMQRVYGTLLDFPV